MRCIAFDFLDQHRYGTAFREYLQIRKRLFVDRLHWNIPHNQEVEMDQYDNPCAHYALVIRNSTVVAGARVMPTTASWGQHSYMLRDALRGQINIPSSVVSEEITTDEVWECTRLVISDEVTSQSERSDCLSLVLSGAVEIVSVHGGRELISLSPVPLVRTLRQLGFAARRVGEPYCETDGRRYAMLRMPALTTAQGIAAE